VLIRVNGAPQHQHRIERATGRLPSARMPRARPVWLTALQTGPLPAGGGSSARAYRRQCTTTTPVGPGGPLQHGLAAKRGPALRTAPPINTRSGSAREARGVISRLHQLQGLALEHPCRMHAQSAGHWRDQAATRRAAPRPSPQFEGGQPPGASRPIEPPAPRIPGARVRGNSSRPTARTRTSRLVIRPGRSGCCSQKAVVQPNSGSSPGSGGGGGSRRSRPPDAAVEHRRKAASAPRRQDPLVADGRAVPQKPDGIGASKARKARRIRRTSSAPPRPGSVSTARAAGPLLQPAARGSRLAAVAGLIQLGPSRACRFARSQLQAGRCRMKRSLLLMGSLLQQQPTDAEPERIAAGPAAQWARPAAQEARQSTGDQLIGPVAACAARLGNSPEPLSRRRVPPTAGPCAPAPGLGKKGTQGRRHPCRSHQAWRRCHGFRVPLAIEARQIAAACRCPPWPIRPPPAHP